MDAVIVNVILLVFLHLSGVGYSLNSYVNCKSCPCFPSNDTQHSMTDVQNILIDAANDRVIVGARDSLVRLDSSTLRLPSAQADFVSLLPTSKAKKTCVDLGFLPDQCFNYIRLLLFDTSGNIFTCGTFASQRRCWRFQRYGILRPLPLEGFSGLHRTPQDYHYAVTGTFSYQYLFTGIDNMAIYRSNPNDTRSNDLQTKISTSVLHEPKFVSSFSDPDNFVYFFVRERAAERSKTIYSRVARVCQYDEGAKIGNLKGIFTSFVKTRVLCSIPGEIPFDFDQIQATFKYYDPKTSRNYIYGIFTTPELGLLSSAVCMYSMADVQELFQKSKYLQKTTTVLHDGSLAWVPASPVNLSVVPGRPKCNSDLKTKDYPFNSYTFAAQHPLLAEPLTSHQRRPLFVRHEMRFTQIVVDKVKGGNGLVTPVMFVSTDNGTVFKVFSNTSGDGNAIIVEQIEVFEKPTPVITMKLYKDAVFVSSYTSVVKLPVERCSKYQTCRTCVSAMDPYCGWSNNKCTTFDNKDGSGWAQDIAHGSYSKVCPEAPPVCSVDVTQERPGGTTLLRCQADGVPVPRITNWTKDTKALPTDGSFLVKQGNAIDQQLLEIQNFGMDHLGLYQCTVSSTLGSSSCAINVTGTLPVISSKLTKINYTSYFTCNATGLPTPGVSVYKVVKGKTSAVNADRVPLAADAGRRSYYCVAQNDFGSTFGVTTFILDKEVKAEVRLTSETWSSELLDKQSDRYKTLSRRIRTTVESAFANDAAFMGFEEISFSKGSVICKMRLIFAAQPSDRNAGLLSDLQQEVSSGKLGDFSVDKSHVLNVEPDVESVTTSPVPALPTTSPTTALRTVATPTTTTVTMVTSVIPEPTPEYRTGESMDGGLFAVAIITAILLSLILGCVLGVKFHSQVARRCSRSSANVESCDGAHDKSVEAVKYTKSPPREEHFVRNMNETQSKRNLLNKKGSKTEADDHSDSDSDSTGSAAGKLGEEDFDNEEVVNAPFSPSKSISPSASIQKTPRVKPSLENGSVSNVA